MFTGDTVNNVERLSLLLYDENLLTGNRLSSSFELTNRGTGPSGWLTGQFDEVSL